jgi:hypothetical protein
VSVISPRGKPLTSQMTSLSLCLMALSTCTGTLFGTTMFARRASTPKIQAEPAPQPAGLPPIELPPAQTVSPPPKNNQIPKRVTAVQTVESAKEHQSISTARSAKPDADEAIGMGWGCRLDVDCRREIKAITKDISVRPNSSNAYCKRAWMYFTLGQFHKAIQDAGKSIRLNQKNADAYEVRSCAYGSLGQERKESQDAERYNALATDPH